MTRTATLLILTSTLFTGCAAPMPPLNTPSGKPEVSIEGKTQAQILDAVTAYCVNKVNGRIEGQTESSVMCLTKLDDFRNALLGIYSQNDVKHRFLTYRQGKGYTLTVQSWVESVNPAGGVQRFDTDYSKPTQASHATQKTLEAIKADLAGK